MSHYVIGDIHGCYEELSRLLDHILCTKGLFDPEYDEMVFIGDYVDRGFGSKKVIDRLIELQKDYPYFVTFLRGNHEGMFMGALGLKDGFYGAYFLRNGGLSTLYSYTPEKLPTIFEFNKLSDLKRTELRCLMEDTYTLEDMKSMVPREHIEFLEQTKLYYDTEKILFVHAGLNPYFTLEDNRPIDFLWVNDNRDRFFSQIAHKPWPKLLVHGHTIINPDEVKKYAKHNRINVDTGCFYNGRLTCLIIEQDKPIKDWRVIQVAHDKKKIYNWK